MTLPQWIADARTINAGRGMFDTNKEHHARKKALSLALDMLEVVHGSLTEDSSEAIAMKHAALEASRKHLDKGYENEFAVAYSEMRKPIDAYFNNILAQISRLAGEKV